MCRLDRGARFHLRAASNGRGFLPMLRLALGFSLIAALGLIAEAGDPVDSAHPDRMKEMQSEAVRSTRASWGHWGYDPGQYSSWTNHSNRLIPVYTFGLTLGGLREQGSVYGDSDRLEQIYGQSPEHTVDLSAVYFDQTDIYRLQTAAVEAGYSYIILMVFDGMDWQTTKAAAHFKTGRVDYDRGRGTGLELLDYRGVTTDYGLMVTSPALSGARTDVDTQLVLASDNATVGGYDPNFGGYTPWTELNRGPYLIGGDRARPHAVTDSASSATSMTSGIKTYNGAINVDVDGRQVEPIAVMLQQEQNFKIGIVTNVPVSHATPAAAYANNVSRQDYQDIARDLLGLRSSAHREQPLPGVDVLIGGGWGEGSGEERRQGDNFVPGNPFLHQDDLRRSDLEQGGRYIVAQRTAGRRGRDVLMEAANRAREEDERLLGFFGTRGGHLPFRTADGDSVPTFDAKGTERYTAADIDENPTLAEMTEAALQVLSRSLDGFWLMVEAGDVDWANHANNLDNSIGAVLSGDEAFSAVTRWIEQNNAWPHTALIVTADHGHFLVIEDPQPIADAGRSRQ